MRSCLNTRTIMLLGQLLIAQGLATKADIAFGLASQSKFGGRLGENLIALGLITRATLDAALRRQYEFALAILTAEDLLAKSERIHGSTHLYSHRYRYRLAKVLV